MKEEKPNKLNDHLDGKTVAKELEEKHDDWHHHGDSESYFMKVNEVRELIKSDLDKSLGTLRRSQFTIDLFDYFYDKKGNAIGLLWDDLGQIKPKEISRMLVSNICSLDIIISDFIPEYYLSDYSPPSWRVNNWHLFLHDDCFEKYKKARNDLQGEGGCPDLRLLETLVVDSGEWSPSLERSGYMLPLSWSAAVDILGAQAEKHYKAIDVPFGYYDVSEGSSDEMPILEEESVETETSEPDQRSVVYKVMEKIENQEPLSKEDELIRGKINETKTSKYKTYRTQYISEHYGHNYEKVIEKMLKGNEPKEISVEDALSIIDCPAEFNDFCFNGFKKSYAKGGKNEKRIKGYKVKIVEKNVGGSNKELKDFFRAIPK